MLSQSQY